MFEDEEDVFESQSITAADVGPNGNSPLDQRHPQVLSPRSPLLATDRTRTNSLSKVEQLRNLLTAGMTSRASVPKAASTGFVLGIMESRTFNLPPSLSPCDPSSLKAVSEIERSPFRSGDRPHLRIHDENLPAVEPLSAKPLNVQIANKELQQTIQQLQQPTSIIEWKDKQIAKLENTIKEMQAEKLQFRSSESLIAKSNSSENLAAPQELACSPADEFAELSILVEYAGKLIDSLVENYVSDDDFLPDLIEQAHIDSAEPPQLLAVNQLLRLKIEERTNQLIEARKDIWSITIQYEDIEQSFELIQTELWQKSQILYEAEQELFRLRDIADRPEEDTADQSGRLESNEPDNLTAPNISEGGDSLNKFEDVPENDKMVQYVRKLEADLSGKEWSIRTAEEEARSLRFTVEETNYCKANLEAELIHKCDLLNKADYSVHVLRSLLEHVDHQRKFLEDSLASQTGNLLTLRDQLDESYIYQRRIEKESSEKGDRLVKSEADLHLELSEKDRLKAALDEQMNISAEAEAALERRNMLQHDMNEKLSQAEKQISWLRSFLDGFKDAMNQMEDQLTSKDGEVQVAKDDIDCLRHEQQQAKSSASCLKGELSAAMAELEKITAKHQAVQLDLAAVHDDKVELEADLKKTRDRLADLESDCDLLRADRSKLTNNKADLERDLTETFEQTRQINHEKIFLRSQLDLSMTTNAELEERLNNASKENLQTICELQAKISDHDLAFQDREAALARREEEITQLRVDLEETRESEETLKESLAEKLADLTDAENTIGHLRDDMESIGHSHHILAQDLANSRQETESLQKMFESLQGTNTNLENEKSALEDELSIMSDRPNFTEAREFKQTIDYLESSRHDLESQLSISHERETALSDKVMQKEAEIHEAEMLIDAAREAMENTTGNLEAQLRKCQAELHQADNDIAFFRSKLAELEMEKTELGNRTKGSEHVQQELDNSRNKNRQLQECLGKVTDKADSLQTQLERAEHVREAMEAQLLVVNIQLETLNSVLEGVINNTIRSVWSDSDTETVKAQSAVYVAEPCLTQASVNQRPATAAEPAKNDETGEMDKTTLFNAIAESKSLLERQLQEKKRECELAQAEIAALRSDNSSLKVRHNTFSNAATTQQEALAAAALDLASVKECLREDLQGVRESSRLAVSGQKRLLNEIRQDLTELAAGLLRTKFGVGADQERSFRIIIRKLADFTSLSVHKITDKVEKDTQRFSKLLRRNAKTLDMIVRRLERIDDPSTSAYNVFSSGAKSYAMMTKELKKVLCEMLSIQAGKPPPRETPDVDLPNHLKQLQHILASIKPAAEVDRPQLLKEARGRKSDSVPRPQTACPVKTHRSRSRSISDSVVSSGDEEALEEDIADIEEELKHWRSLAIGRTVHRSDGHFAWKAQQTASDKYRPALRREQPAESRPSQKVYADGCTCPVNRG